MFELIPCIYAGDLPNDVEQELMSWNDELCFHGDGGCVFSLHEEHLVKLPLFCAWMVKIGAWTQDQVDERTTHYTTYEEFCREENLNDGPPYPYFNEYYKKYPAKQSLVVAMTGT